MTRYAVCLEEDDGGRCMAHALDLPGCFTRGANRDAALKRMPAAIRGYHAWLRRHGEPAPPEDEHVEVGAVEQVGGSGPFDPGDVAALFALDREPVTPEEMEGRFRLMAYSRADLLALVRDLPDDVLDWQQTPDALSLRCLLRHIGNAEEWYVSRIVPPDTLPPEWEHDGDRPVFEFLAMERRTALERLRQLTEEQRAGVFHPTRWTDHPEEPWTTRKALRRFLEHEREHVAQAREILLAWWEAVGRREASGPNAALLAGLRAARDELLAAAALVPPAARAERLVCGEWTLKDVLGHVADWEWVGVEGLRCMAAGRSPRVEHIESLNAWNQAHCEARRDQPWAEVWADLCAAREAMLKTLEGMGRDDLAQHFPFPWGSEGTAYKWAAIYLGHDVEHARDIIARDLTCASGDG